jgi:crossover junction endodeoxyribonuclease RusA
MNAPLELPWPPSALTPNAKRRKHWRVYQPIANAYKLQCIMLVPATIPDGTHLDITFMPPDRRRRDLDGMLGAFKHGIDAIASVLCIDDYEFSLSLRRGEPIKGGKVMVTIGGSRG